MDVRSVGLTLTCLMALFTPNGEYNIMVIQPQTNDLKKQKGQKLQLEKTSRMYVKDGLSPMVLSTVSGSFPPHTLVILTMFLLIQTCGGAEETSPEWPYMKVDTTPKAPQSSYLSEHPILLGFGVLAVFAILLAICSFCCKSTGDNPSVDKSQQTSSGDPTEGVIENPSAEVQQSPLDGPTEVLVHSSKKEKNKIVSKLMEQKDDIVKLMEELQSQCLEVDRENVENKEKLQLVEKELENETVHNRQELLREKENLLESKWKLEEKKTDQEKVLLQTEELLQTIDAATGEEDYYIVSKLMEQMNDIVKLKNELQSQRNRLDSEKVENKVKLQLVEKELENETVHNRQELLREKENLLESKWKLEEKKTDKEKVLLQTEELLQTIDAATGEEDKLQSPGLEVYREKVENNEKLQLVDNELENKTVHYRHELLREKEVQIETLREEDRQGEGAAADRETTAVVAAVTGEEDKLQSQGTEVNREEVEHWEKLQPVETELLQIKDAAINKMKGCKTV